MVTFLFASGGGTWACRRGSAAALAAAGVLGNATQGVLFDAALGGRRLGFVFGVGRILFLSDSRVRNVCGDEAVYARDSWVAPRGCRFFPGRGTAVSGGLVDLSGSGRGAVPLLERRSVSEGRSSHAHAVRATLQRGEWWRSS